MNSILVVITFLHIYLASIDSILLPNDFSMTLKNIIFSTGCIALLTPRQGNCYTIYMQLYFGIIQYF